MAQQRNRVRIIAGKYRRRLLPFPDVDGLRPTPDRVRETVFNWLADRIENADCLDLFAGSGAMGFEAASRGARKVVLVEKSRAALQCLRDSKALLAAVEVQLHSGSAEDYLARNSDRFDLIFLDPPYALTLLPALLPRVGRMLKAGGCIYMESDRPEQFAGWRVLKEGRAGAVRFALLAPGDGE
ncbi:16S rRNA (guanine(966)-N(2))-methyltransferase RsmD [Vogesella fluminis]|uniref:Ribosomal RNA small subunit methyltransferase D n=1 Tax=Vogesella fluminis TaxID=1069161 RepID=A0ABQ3HCZ7_9NEIS|nr:16S rRNA (guanine(966)-N(2))-methyltransferase RsmD [Vogesella fluminis]GHD79749.1 ribosomal RNA small subunit methyltransferase D [Vogesella fluminis]